MHVFGSATVKRTLLLFAGVGGAMVAAWLLMQNVYAVLSRASATDTVLLLEPPIGELDHSVTEAYIELPYSIPGTDLVAQRVCAYEGPYLEDGTGDEVVDAAALLLWNTGSKGVERAQVRLLWQQGEYVFDADMIPAGGSVLVLERDRKGYGQRSWTGCAGWQALSQSAWNDESGITVTEIDMGTLAVTNGSDTAFSDVWLYYKSYLPQPGIYVGGITYKAGIQRIEPGQTVQISPPHYACGCSGIVRISARKAD